MLQGFVFWCCCCCCFTVYLYQDINKVYFYVSFKLLVSSPSFMLPYLLLRKPDYLFSRLSHHLYFDDCIPMVLLNVFLCLPHFLGIARKCQSHCFLCLALPDKFIVGIVLCISIRGWWLVSPFAMRSWSKWLFIGDYKCWYSNSVILCSLISGTHCSQRDTSPHGQCVYSLFQVLDKRQDYYLILSLTLPVFKIKFCP